MSEFHVEVVKISNIEKHPNADSLSITLIHDGYPVIFRTGDFQLNDLAVYIPVDAYLPKEDPQFSFLGGQQRIKAKRLRGVFSMGLLVKSRPEWVEGQNVQEELNIKKWEPPSFLKKKSHRGFSLTATENETPPFLFPEYTDIEGLRKFSKVLEEGEEVIITEKIHGANARYLYKNERLWVGSRKFIKKENLNSPWWIAAKDYNLEERLKQYPDFIFYCELYGKVQDLTYGEDGYKLLFFDIFNLSTHKYLDLEEFTKITSSLDLPTTPILFQGPWGKELKQLSNGLSTIAKANHIREGFVVKPVKERWDARLGRVALKLVGEDYLLR
jgi:RNA ligase (TIGR02306 family)